MNILVRYLSGLLLIILSPLVSGHAQLLVAPAPDDQNPSEFISPLPREDNVRMKDILPCGGFQGKPPASVKGQPQRVYASGSTVRVHWKETNDHSGVWRIDISADYEKSWQVLFNIKDGADDGVTELTEEMPKYYWADITLPPGLKCESCTFRLTQSMGNIDDGNDYFSCADITIK
jgi:hypothetical protein